MERSDINYKRELILRNEVTKDHMSDLWYVYIIECKDGELYVGVAKDVKKRVELHNKGLACRYTKFRKSVKLIYIEKHMSQKVALKREKEIKGFSRKKKSGMIKDSSG